MVDKIIEKTGPAVQLDSAAQTKGERTRERILDVAYESIVQKGFAATSIEELVEAALSRERAALMEEVRQERIAAFLAADSLAQRSIDRTGAMLRQLILEFTVGALIVVVALLVSGFVLVNRWRAKAA